jgi:hypothetical protein
VLVWVHDVIVVIDVDGFCRFIGLRLVLFFFFFFFFFLGWF